MISVLEIMVKIWFEIGPTDPEIVGLNKKKKRNRTKI